MRNVEVAEMQNALREITSVTFIYWEAFRHVKVNIYHAFLNINYLYSRNINQIYSYWLSLIFFLIKECKLGKLNKFYLLLNCKVYLQIV